MYYIIYVYRYRIGSSGILNVDGKSSIRLACIPHYHYAVYTHICIVYGIVCTGHSIGISCYFSRIWVRVAGAVKHDVYMHIAECRLRRRRQQRRWLDLFWGKRRLCSPSLLLRAAAAAADAWQSVVFDYKLKRSVTFLPNFWLMVFFDVWIIHTRARCTHDT